MWTQVPSTRALTYFIMSCIVILAFLLRSYDVGENPPGFFVDEATHGLDAYNIFKSGKDYHEASFPIFFEAAGEYRSPIWVYLSTFIIGLLGMSIETVRLSSALQGAMTVVIMYFVGRSMFRSNIAGIISSLLIAISPWHVFMSRIGFEIVTYVLGLSLLILFLSVQMSKGKTFIFLSVGVLLFSFLTYTISRFMTPIVAIVFMLCNPRYLVGQLRNWRFYIMLSIAIGAVALIIYLNLEENKFFKRWEDVKPTSMNIEQFINGYRNHFHIDYLFIKGDSGFQNQSIFRHSYSNIGLIYWVQLPLILIGFIWSITKPRVRGNGIFLLFMIVLYPLGSIIVDSMPFATRSALGIIPFTLLSAIGVQVILNGLMKRGILMIFYTISIVIVCGHIIYGVLTLHNAMYSYKMNYHAASWEGWQYGFKESLELLSSYENQYDELYITHRFSANQFLYDFFDSQTICPTCWGMQNPITIDPSKKQLFVLREDDVQQAKELHKGFKFQQIQVIRSPNGSSVLYVGYFQ
jgi:4-amino-4-deoxy-L-arabinose transferase-like glycosyltransferase